MCLAFISYQQHPKFPLLIAANRDEFYDRPTLPASEWSDVPGLVAGRDQAGGGTWMGVTRAGRVGLITNYRDPAHLKTDAPSRGKLVSDFLSGEMSAETFLHDLQPNAATYNGFNLIVGSMDALYYFSNYREGVLQLPPGYFGLSNALLDSHWPKVQDGKERLRPLLFATEPDPEAILQAMCYDTPATDDRLPQTGVGLEWERVLSPMFIRSPRYGTRCTTVLMIDNAGRIQLTERTYTPQGASTTRSFQLNPSA
ncbi:MAG: NRDE family protein [Cyclobacteriaceae bacterium]|nr:NRDE family protein [Cyclobacteriaceae bacterium]